MNYSLSINDQGEGFITFVANGRIETVPSDHPNFRQVAAALLAGEDPAEYLSVQSIIESLSERVDVVDDDIILFDGEEVDDRLARTILRYKAEGRDTAGLVAFMEKLSANPSKRARTELFDFVENQQLVITPDGDFVAHKAVRPADIDDYVLDAIDATGYLVAEASDLFASISQGTACVNDVEFTGAIPNFVGAVVTMPRKDVDDDHGRDCSEGLHVGSFRYASTFGGYGSRLMEVAVSPADVVTVPKYDTNKLRCCRYTVLAVQEEKHEDLSDYEAEATADLDEVFELLEDYEVPAEFVAVLRARIAGAVA